MINSRLRRLKAVLWAFMGALVVLSILRFANGLGVTTGLTDSTPWGFWIAFDVMAGVALAAGGFVVAGSVYIFGLEKFRPFVRPAILTALLGYTAVAIGLLYDLGLPWHIWHPIIYPQVHSVLFEVAMCVMLYLAVLFLEFSPVILEHPKFDKPFFRKLHAVLKKLVIPLVIVGIVLSTLHQSSLGSLFLIQPYRVHPLWYSPIIWVMFFISAIALGLATVTLESFFSSWAFGHKLRMELLSKLGRAASIVLFVYIGVRFLDLAIRGQLAHMLDGTYQSTVFLVEVIGCALLPAVLLSFKRVREHPKGLMWAAILVVAGVLGYRFNVCIVAFLRPDAMPYFPAWTEVMISLGIVAAAVLVFITLVENLRVYTDDEDLAEEARPATSAFSPHRTGSMMPDSLAAPRRYSLAFVVGACLILALLPSDVLFGAQPAAVPVHTTRQVEGGMVLDGNRDGRFVLFPHRAHEEALGGDDSCVTCHHQNLPFETRSTCTSCHRDMYSVTDTFQHASHVAYLGGNDGCVRCHTDASAAKTRANTTACDVCHTDMVAEGSRVALGPGGLTGRAPGFMEAMHGLCAACHKERVEQEPEVYSRGFGECGHCHHGDTLDLGELGPYAQRDEEAPPPR